MSLRRPSQRARNSSEEFDRANRRMMTTPVRGTIGTIVLHWLAVIFVVGTPHQIAAAVHPVSVTRTLVYVARDRVSVTVEVFLEDLVLFHSLKPNAADSLDLPTIQQGIELHQEFVTSRFVIQDAEGTILTPDQPPNVTAEIPEAGVPMAQLMAHNLTFDMQYTVTSAPEFLTFQQRFTDPDGVLLSEMQLQVKQENAADMFSKALIANTPETIRFDWTHPPLPAEASQQERDRWTQQQQEEALGIMSYSSVYSFLYIEPREVRHEILIPLMTLEQSVPLKREQSDFLSIPEQDAVQPLIEEFFRTGNPITIDGSSVAPFVERCDFYGVDFRDFAQLSERKPVALSNARVGIILVYPVTSAPRSVRLTWDRFHKSLWAVTTVVFAADHAFRKTLSRVGENNGLEWNAPDDSPMDQIAPLSPIVAIPPPRATITVPVLSLGLLVISVGAMIVSRQWQEWRIRLRVAAIALAVTSILFGLNRFGQWKILWDSTPAISNSEAYRVADQTLSNIYQSFRSRGEDETYDALAVSTAGDLLQDLYLQIQESLRMAEQGGAVARVKQVELLDAQLQQELLDGREIENSQAFACLCRWNVSGTVEHWGHIHERTNQFEAALIFEPMAEPSGNESPGSASPTSFHWKLTRLNITNSQRLQFETRLRTLSIP